MADKKPVKKTTTIDKIYNITKSNGNVIQRKNLEDVMLARYKKNGWTVKEVV